MVLPTYLYTYAPSTSTAAGQRDLLRLLLGDTNVSSSGAYAIFADQELAYFWDEGHGNPHLACHHAATAASGRYSQLADKALGPMKISYGQIAESFRKQAAEELNNATNTANVSPQPYSFTQEVGDRDLELEQGDLKVPAFFNRDQDDNDADMSSEREHWC